MESRLDRKKERKMMKFPDNLLSIWIVFVFIMIGFACIYRYFDFGSSLYTPIKEGESNYYEQVETI